MERLEGRGGRRHDIILISKIKEKNQKNNILVNNVSEYLQNILNIPLRKANNS